MPNHFHLLLQVRKTPLAKVMSSLITSFSMYINRTHERVGTLFQNRYKSKLVYKDNYFLGASRYIHLNPLSAGLVKELHAYPWSSYTELFGQSQYAIIDKREVERLIGTTDEDKKQYHQFLQDGIREYENLQKAYTFEDDVEGEPGFSTQAIRKYLRRKKRKL